MSLQPAPERSAEGKNQLCPYCKSSLYTARSVIRHIVNTADPKNPIDESTLGCYVTRFGSVAFHGETSFDYSKGTYCHDNDYDVCAQCGKRIPQHQIQPKKQALVYLCLRTETDDGKTDKELFVPALSVHFQPLNGRIEFLGDDECENNEWNVIVISKEGNFIYNGHKFDVCFIYPNLNTSTSASLTAIVRS